MVSDPSGVDPDPTFKKNTGFESDRLSKYTRIPPNPDPQPLLQIRIPEQKIIFFRGFIGFHNKMSKLFKFD